MHVGYMKNYVGLNMKKWIQNTAAPKKGTEKGCVGTIQKLFYLFIYDLGEIMSFAFV